MCILLKILFSHFALSIFYSVDPSLADDVKYNIGAFAVDAHGSKEILQQNTGIAAYHADYIVQNIGRDAIWVEMKYGTLALWHGTVVGYMVEPGEKKLFNNYGTKYFVTALKLVNDHDERGIVIATVVEGSFTVSLKNQSVAESTFDINEFAKFYYATVTDNIPYIGATLSHFIEYFWPDTEEEDVWDQIKDRVSEMIDSKISDTIENLLDSNLRSLKKKVRSLDRSIKKGISGSNITDHFMNIAQDFIGIEEAFRFRTKNNMDANKINYVVLPLYSTIITMKLIFYRTGIKNKEKLGLNDAKISQLKLYSEEMLDDGVLTHISQVYEERMNYEYENCEPENIFNALATVQTFTAINGLENLPMWEQWIRQPFSNYTPYCDTITISKSYGSVTTDLLMEVAGGKFGKKLLPSLIQKEIHGKPVQVRQCLQSLQIEHDGHLIKAITTHFDNVDFRMGTRGDKKATINLNRKYLKKIEAFGKKIIAGLRFTLSDGTTKQYGSINMSHNSTFKRDGHHICGIFVGPDVQMQTNVIASMAVSYVKDQEYDFM